METETETVTERRWRWRWRWRRRQRWRWRRLWSRIMDFGAGFLIIIISNYHIVKRSIRGFWRIGIQSGVQSRREFFVVLVVCCLHLSPFRPPFYLCESFCPMCLSVRTLGIAPLAGGGGLGKGVISICHLPRGDNGGSDDCARTHGSADTRGHISVNQEVVGTGC